MIFSAVTAATSVEPPESLSPATVFLVVPALSILIVSNWLAVSVPETLNVVSAPPSTFRLTVSAVPEAKALRKPTVVLEEVCVPKAVIFASA